MPLLAHPANVRESVRQVSETLGIPRLLAEGASRSLWHEEGIDRKALLVQNGPLPAAPRPQRLRRMGVYGRFALKRAAIGDLDLAFTPSRGLAILELFPWM